MRPRELRLLVLLAALAVSGVILRTGAGTPPASSATVRFAAPSAASRAQGLRFEGVSEPDRAEVLAAVAGARPQARRLIDAVAGLVTVRVGDTGPTASGLTDSSSTGYLVQLDLAEVRQALGPRGVSRLVLHELGHVVRHAVVPDAVLTQLDAEIPRGYGCADGVGGACANPEERFAETFAKWAMDDIGIALDIGYRVPPPNLTLDAWAAPLTLLAR